MKEKGEIPYEHARIHCPEPVALKPWHRASVDNRTAFAGIEQSVRDQCADEAFRYAQHYTGNARKAMEQLSRCIREGTMLRTTP